MSPSPLISSNNLAGFFIEQPTSTTSSKQLASSNWPEIVIKPIKLEQTAAAASTTTTTNLFYSSFESLNNIANSHLDDQEEEEETAEVCSSMERQQSTSGNKKCYKKRPQSQEEIIEECKNSLNELIKASKWPTFNKNGNTTNAVNLADLCSPKSTLSIYGNCLNLDKPNGGSSTYDNLIELNERKNFKSSTLKKSHTLINQTFSEIATATSSKPTFIQFKNKTFNNTNNANSCNHLESDRESNNDANNIDEPRPTKTINDLNSSNNSRSIIFIYFLCLFVNIHYNSTNMYKSFDIYYISSVKLVRS